MNKSNRKNMSNNKSKSKGKGCGCLSIFLALMVIGMIANACDPDSDTDADITEPASGIERAIESDNAGTDAADSEAADTVYFETQIAPETETQETLPETETEAEPAETEPETEAVEEPTFGWDTVAESVSESESNWIEPVVEVIPETEPAIVIVHEDSSMTPELIDQLEGVAFFWAPTGNKVHIDPTCRTFKKGYTFAGTLSEAQSVRTDGWCGICSGGDTTTNGNATPSALAECYTYDDFLNGIPAAAFED